MHQQRFCDLLAYRQNGVQGSHRILKNHGDLVSAYRAHFLFGKGRQLFSFKPDLSPGHFSRPLRKQLHYGKCSWELLVAAIFIRMS